MDTRQYIDLLATIEFWAALPCPAPAWPGAPVFWRKRRLFAAGVPRGTLVFAWSSQKVKTGLVLPALKQWQCGAHRPPPCPSRPRPAQGVALRRAHFIGPQPHEARPCGAARGGLQSRALRVPRLLRIDSGASRCVVVGLYFRCAFWPACSGSLGSA